MPYFKETRDMKKMGELGREQKINNVWNGIMIMVDYFERMDRKGGQCADWSLVFSDTLIYTSMYCVSSRLRQWDKLLQHLHRLNQKIINVVQSKEPIHWFSALVLLCSCVTDIYEVVNCCEASSLGKKGLQDRCLIDKKNLDPFCRFLFFTTILYVEKMIFWPVFNLTNEIHNGLLNYCR